MKGEIRSIGMSRSDGEGEPSADGDLDITFYDEDGLIVASATVKPSGWACAHSITGGKILARAVITPGETESQ